MSRGLAASFCSSARRRSWLNCAVIEFSQPFPRFPRDELAHARVRTLLYLPGGPVEDHLGLVLAQARKRVEHDDPVRNFEYGLHVVRDGDACSWALPAGLEN